ncbi:MAG TPA: hypothetical protein VNF47_06845 [Streptosporangiaceae bacterium]|nr:hypothetical protein [Streptosporangiaceae bacterium]
MGQLDQMSLIIAVRQQGTDSMADPDHPVSRGGHYAWQQPGPPGIEHLPPRLLADFAVEERRPVGDPARVAERLLPVVPEGAFLAQLAAVRDPWC